MPTKIKVSAACYHEIASALEKDGKKFGQNVGTLTLEKDDEIVNPIDWRLATVRKDCLIETVKVYASSGGTIEILKVADEMFNFVINGKVENVESKTPSGKETAGFKPPSGW